MALPCCKCLYFWTVSFRHRSNWITSTASTIYKSKYQAKTGAARKKSKLQYEKPQKPTLWMPDNKGIWNRDIFSLCLRSLVEKSYRWQQFKQKMVQEQRHRHFRSTKPKVRTIPCKKYKAHTHTHYNNHITTWQFYWVSEVSYSSHMKIHYFTISKDIGSLFKLLQFA